MGPVPHLISSNPTMTGQLPETRMKMVDPGVVTGVYYITFCNVCVRPDSAWLAILCFNVSDMLGEIQIPPHVPWQQLKRHIAQVCEVDRVEIFPASTSGWVRLKGHHNFEKAWGESTWMPLERQR